MQCEKKKKTLEKGEFLIHIHRIQAFISFWQHEKSVQFRVRLYRFANAPFGIFYPFICTITTAIAFSLVFMRTINNNDGLHITPFKIIHIQLFEIINNIKNNTSRS